MRKIIIYVALIVCSANCLNAHKTNNVTEQPEISVIGEVYSQTSDADHISIDDQHKLFLQSVELTIQGDIYPKLRADIVFAMHRHDEELEWELEEAKFIAREIIGGFGLQGGKALIDAGKINAMHPHHWPYFSQPAVLENFFGRHGLLTEGIQADCLLPLPFFMRLSAGTWEAASAHNHDNGEEDGGADEHSESFSLASHIATQRLLSCIILSRHSKLEAGLSHIEGSGSHHAEHKDWIQLYGADITFNLWAASYRKIILQGEFFQINRHVPVKEIQRFGYYIYSGCSLNVEWEIGMRYDNSENVIPDKKITESLSSIITYNLNEASYLRSEYKYGVQPETSNTFYLQFVFTMGLHNHHRCSH